jgi:uncharacterized membrane protein YqjE
MNTRPTDGIVRSGQRMLAILVSMVKTRLGLLAIELLEEKRRIWLLLVLTVLALIFVSLALLMLSLLVIVAYWEEGRLIAIGALFAFYVAATIAILLILRRKTMSGSTLFAASLGELSKDHAALEEAFEDEGEFDDETDVDVRQRRRRG